MHSYFIGNIGDTLANHGRLLLAVAFLFSVIYAWHEHGELAETIRTTSGQEQANARRRRTLLWILPVLSLLGAVASQWGSEKSDDSIRRLTTNESNLTTNVSFFSNRLVETETKLSRSEESRKATERAASEAIAAAANATVVVAKADTLVLQNLPRRLTDTQNAELMKALAGLPKGQVAFSIDPVIPDSEVFANDIATVLVRAGFTFVGADSIDRNPKSRIITVGTFGATNSPVAKVLADTLTSMGFPAATNRGDFRRPNMTYIDIGRK